MRIQKAYLFAMSSTTSTSQGVAVPGPTPGPAPGPPPEPVKPERQCRRSALQKQINKRAPPAVVSVLQKDTEVET